MAWGGQGSAASAGRAPKGLKRQRFDVVVCWPLDRLRRNLKHLVTVLDDLQGLGIDFASRREGIDATTPAGRLQLQVLAALSNFERVRIRKRVLAGQLAKAQGQRSGRPRRALSPTAHRWPSAALASTAAGRFGVSRATAFRWIRPARSSQSVSETPVTSALPASGSLKNLRGLRHPALPQKTSLFHKL